MICLSVQLISASTNTINARIVKSDEHWFHEYSKRFDIRHLSPFRVHSAIAASSAQNCAAWCCFAIWHRDSDSSWSHKSHFHYRVFFKHTRPKKKQSNTIHALQTAVDTHTSSISFRKEGYLFTHISIDSVKLLSARSCTCCSTLLQEDGKEQHSSAKASEAHLMALTTSPLCSSCGGHSITIWCTWKTDSAWRRWRPQVLGKESLDNNYD